MNMFVVQLTHNGFGFAGYICSRESDLATGYSSDPTQAIRTSLEDAEVLRDSMSYIKSFSAEVVPMYNLKEENK